MLGRLQRHGDPGLRRELASPQPRRQHDLLALDLAALGADADDAVVIEHETGDLGVLEDPRAALPGTLGHRHRHVDRVGPALVRRPEAVDDVVGTDQRHQLGDLTRRQHLLGHPDRAHVRRLATVGLVPPLGRGQLEVAALPEPGREPGLLLESRVQLRGVARHPQRVLRRTPGDDLAGRVPGRTRRELLALEQYDVGRAQHRQVIGDRGPDHAAPDDDELSSARQILRRTGRCVVGPSRCRVDGGEVERHGGTLPVSERSFNLPGEQPGGQGRGQQATVPASAPGPTVRHVRWIGR